MNQPKFDSLDAALASVRREVQPTRDLWPGIAREMASRADSASGAPSELASARAKRAARATRSQWPLALAASVAVMSLAVALYWSVVQQHRSAEAIAKAMAAQAAHIQLVTFGPPQDADYLAAHAALERTFNNRLKLLAPATRARVEADLQIIRRANEDLRSALAHDPASPLLLQLLHSTSQQEIDLYTSVAQSTEPLLMRRTKA
jgi:hypothetical protein